MKSILTIAIAVTSGILYAGFVRNSGDPRVQKMTNSGSSETAVIKKKGSDLASRPRIPVGETVEMATFPKGVEDPAPEPISVPLPPTGDAAAFCDALDLVERPDLADEMVKMAAAEYGTPAGLLNGIWETESNHGIFGRTGKCSVMDEYVIRDCWKPGSTTKRPEGCTSPYIFAGESPSATRWKKIPKKNGRIGNGTRQRQAVIRIAAALGIDAWSIKGSCGNRSLTGLKNPRKKPTHGGCFGDMQITPTEWERDVGRMGYGLSKLTPFNICDSMLVSSYRLRRHHDERLKRYRKELGGATGRIHDQLSWIWSGRRYYGNPEGDKASTYEFHNKWGRGNPNRRDIYSFIPKGKFPCGWDCWDDMEARRDFSPLNDYVYRRGGRKSVSYREVIDARKRKTNRYASN